MRVSASEKLELIRLVEGSSLSIRRTLAEIGLARSTFYAWYKRYLEGDPEALVDRKPRRRPVWNRIPERIRTQVVETARSGRSRMRRVSRTIFHSSVVRSPSSKACTNGMALPWMGAG